MVSGSFARKRRTQRKQRKLRKQRKQRTQRNKQYGGALTENDHIFFWEAYEIPYGFLSNYYTRENKNGNHCQASSQEIFDKFYNENNVIKFTYGAYKLANSEQALCLEKALFMRPDSDNEADNDYTAKLIEKILEISNPYIIKMLGGTQAGYTDSTGTWKIKPTRSGDMWGDWDKVNGEIMYRILMAKFRPTPEDRHMFDRLDATGEAQLVEASPDDSRWGIGFDTAHALMNTASWGENRLGKLLMRVRKDLRGEQTDFNGANNARGNHNNDGDAW